MASGETKGKKNLVVRDVPLADHEALERVRKRLHLKREPFVRSLVHRAIWSAHLIFERDIREALGPEPADESAEVDESAEIEEEEPEDA